MQVNENYSSVDRVGPKQDLYLRIPEHLALPKYDDSFVNKNDPKLLRELTKGNLKSTLNELKWKCSLRRLKEQRNLRPKLRELQHK